MASDPRELQGDDLLQRFVGGLPGGDPRRAARGHRQGGGRDLPRREVDQHFEAAALTLRTQDALLFQVPSDAPLLPEAFHLPLQPGAKEYHSRVKHYRIFFVGSTLSLYTGIKVLMQS